MKIHEVIGPTIQGEGKNAGKPVMFIRVARCNLACGYCDTPFTWNWIGTKFLHPDKYDPKQEMHEVSIDSILAKLQELSQTTKHIVVSGGEPLLQQNELTELIRLVKEQGYFVEVETNGTIVPTDEFLGIVDQVNCSPKLSNSGSDNRPTMRERPKALKRLSQSEKTCFKFVVTSDDDMREIVELIKKYNLQQVYLMAEGQTKEEQESRQEQVQELAQRYGFSFSPRLHVLQWGNRRGV